MTRIRILAGCAAVVLALPALAACNGGKCRASAAGSTFDSVSDHTLAKSGGGGGGSKGGGSKKKSSRC